MTTTHEPTHRVTSQYTLTLGVDNPAAAQAVLDATLTAAGIQRTGTVGDRDHAGVSWRASSDTQAQATAAVLEYAVEKAQPISTSRLHTGFGAHTRDLSWEGRPYVPGELSDRDALDQIADVLAAPVWSGADMLEAIANILGDTERPHPGGFASRAEYADTFATLTGRDVIRGDDA